MGFLNGLKNFGLSMLDASFEASFNGSVIDRPIICTEITYAAVKEGLQKRIAEKDLLIKAETREGWKTVGLVRALTETRISYSPHKQNNFSINTVEITKNHTGKIVARAKGRWIDSGMSVSGSSN